MIPCSQRQTLSSNNPVYPLSLSHLGGYPTGGVTPGLTTAGTLPPTADDSMLSATDSSNNPVYPLSLSPRWLPYRRCDSGADHGRHSPAHGRWFHALSDRLCLAIILYILSLSHLGGYPTGGVTPGLTTAGTLPPTADDSMLSATDSV